MLDSKVIIVIPTYNEKANVKVLCQEIFDILPRASLLFVDDNSPDGTAELIKSLNHNQVQIITRNSKQGLGTAYITAFKKIMNDKNAELVLTMDADLSHPPQALVKFLEFAEAYDLIIGSRYVKGGQITNWSYFRRLLSRTANIFLRLTTHLPIKDITSGFMAIRCSALKKLDLDDFKSEGYAFLVDLKYRLISRSHASFCEFPIEFTERREGKSKLGLVVIGESLIFPLQIYHNSKKISMPWSLSIFLISLGFYVATMPQSIFLNDNAEFITAAKVLGIPHPSGYPLFVILSHVFTYLPFGTVVFRVNLFNAISTSISLVLVYLIVEKIIISFKQHVSIFEKAILALGALGLGFVPIVWEQAIVAKTYSLNLLFVALITYLLITWLQDKKNKNFYASAILFGLGLTNHPMLVLAFPAFALIIFYGRKHLNLRLLGLSLFLVLLGLTPYLYLPIRSAQNPLYFWGHTNDSIGQFFYFILRRDYSDFGVSSSLTDKFRFFASFCEFLYIQFKFGIILAVTGIFYAVFKNRKVFSFILLIIFFNAIGIILLRKASFSMENELYYETYYLPAIVFVGILAILGLDCIFNLLNRFRRAILVSPLLLVVPLVYLPVNYGTTNLTHFNFIEDYARAVLENLPQNSVLLLSFEGPMDDPAIFALLYEHDIPQLRPDITIIGLLGTVGTPDKDRVIAIYDEKDLKKMRADLVNYALSEPTLHNRPIYTTFQIDGLLPDFYSNSNGLVYRLNKTNSAVPNFFSIKLTASDQKILTRDFFGSDFLAQYYYAQAAAYVDRKDFVNSQHLFIQALNADQDIGSIDQETYRYHRDQTLRK